MAEITDQEFVESIVRGLVGKPESVKTDRTIDQLGVLIELHVDPEDMGTVIGREGNTAKAIRKLLSVFGAKRNARVNLKIVEPEGGTGGSRKADDQKDQSADQPAAEEAKEEKLEDDVPTDLLA